MNYTFTFIRLSKLIYLNLMPFIIRWKPEMTSLRTVVFLIKK